MPRASNGIYSLPAGNPVTTLSVISSTWANTTLSDISTALTGSLDRSGQGAMLAGLKLFDGVIGAPGLTWGTETTAGIYRNAAGDFRFAVGGVDVFTFKTGGTTGLFANGAVGAPAISWSAEPTSGMYRNAAADFRWALGGADFIQWTTNLEQISGTAPIRRWNESDAAANNKLWDIIASGEDMNFRVLTDALAATNWMTITRTAGTVDSITLAASALALNGPTTFNNSGLSTAAVQLASAAPTLLWFETDAAANNGKWYIQANTEALQFGAANDAFGVATNFLQVDRTGTTIDTINFGNGTLQYGGNEVGYRSLIGRVVVAADSTAAADNGRLVIAAGGGGYNFTIDSDFGVTNYIMTLINANTAAITIVDGIAGTVQWFNGSGVIPTGNRTLAGGGVATIYMVDATNAYVWGTGLS